MGTIGKESVCTLTTIAKRLLNLAFTCYSRRKASNEFARSKQNKRKTEQITTMFFSRLPHDNVGNKLSMNPQS